MDRGETVANKWLLISTEYDSLIEFQSRMIFALLKTILTVKDGYFLLI